MKWTPKTLSPEGDLRHRTRFLLFPMTIDKQTRWLERATWVEQALAWHTVHGTPAIKWQPISWRDYTPKRNDFVDFLNNLRNPNRKKIQ
jgi:hypothetical protein